MWSLCRIMVYSLPAILSVYSADDTLFLAGELSLIRIKKGIYNKWKNLYTGLDVIRDHQLDKTRRVLYFKDRKRLFAIQLDEHKKVSTLLETKGKELATMLRDSYGNFCVDDGIFVMKKRSKIIIYNSNTTSRSELNINVSTSRYMMCQIIQEENRKYVYLAYKRHIHIKGKRYVIARCLLIGDDCEIVFTVKNEIFHFEMHRDTMIFETVDNMYVASREAGSQTPSIISETFLDMSFAIVGNYFYYISKRNITRSLKSRLPWLDPVYIPCYGCHDLFVIPALNDTHVSDPRVENPIQNYVPTDKNIESTSDRHKAYSTEFLPANRTEGVEENRYMKDIGITLCSLIGFACVVLAVCFITHRYCKINMLSKHTKEEHYSSYRINHNTQHGNHMELDGVSGPDDREHCYTSLDPTSTSQPTQQYMYYIDVL